ncbi:hypothetical protein [Halodesulfovibrio spirochaetisodalis]|nr:hypothetical protein [Halodesulfovibrio spirochaetisodalis]
MSPRNSTILHCCLLCLFMTLSTGCIRSLPMFGEPATVVSDKYFSATRDLPEELQDKLPSDVIYYEPQKSSALDYYSPKQFSKTAYNNLSLNFLWTGEQHSLPINGTTYAAMPSSGQKTVHRGTELTISNEFSKETLKLLAILDWENTGSKDWLVLYSFESLVQPETSTRLLLVRDVQPGRTLTATVLSASECFGNNCQEYSGYKLSEFLEYEPAF